MRRWKVLAGLVVYAAAVGASGQELTVKTKLGKVVGKMDGAGGSQVRAFLGIPFAAPPVGPLRWREPMPPMKWKGERAATAFGSRCMQPTIYADMVFRDPGISEDCLTLNIWSPAKDKKAKLPVMVWVYGGGFLAGSTSERRQDGVQLATNGVVVVTMNYRMGIFGFFANHELAAESGRNSAGNYGLLDQTAALRWVQANIAAFGGDPGNVTLFGESAGSFSVSAQMASPLAKGLFQRAIGESGGAMGGASLSFKPLADTEATDEAFAKAVMGSGTLRELRAMPAAKLLEAQMTKDATGATTRFTGGVDGYLLPESPAAIFAAGRQNDVPLMAGWNRDEQGIDPKVTQASLRAKVEKDFPDHAAEMLALYGAANDEEAVRSSTDLAADRFIAYGTWRWLELQAKTGKQPVYSFRFDQVVPADPNHPGGISAYHSGEIPYVFGSQELLSDFGYHWLTEDRRLSAEMQRYWANFAKSGDPNGEGLPVWPKYEAGNGWTVMHLAATSVARADEHRARDLFLDGMWGR